VINIIGDRGDDTERRGKVGEIYKRWRERDRVEQYMRYGGEETER
jgi:hypothetical protein